MNIINYSKHISNCVHAEGMGVHLLIVDKQYQVVLAELSDKCRREVDMPMSRVVKSTKLSIPVQVIREALKQKLPLFLLPNVNV